MPEQHPDWLIHFPDFAGSGWSFAELKGLVATVGGMVANGKTHCDPTPLFDYLISASQTSPGAWKALLHLVDGAPRSGNRLPDCAVQWLADVATGRATKPTQTHSRKPNRDFAALTLMHHYHSLGAFLDPDDNRPGESAVEMAASGFGMTDPDNPDLRMTTSNAKRVLNNARKRAREIKTR